MSSAPKQSRCSSQAGKASVEVNPQPEERVRQSSLDLRKFKAKGKLSLSGRAACVLGPKENGGEFPVKLYSFLLSLLSIFKP